MLKTTKISRFRALLFCILPLAAAAGCANNDTSTTDSASTYKAGVQTAAGTGYGGNINVSVTFSEEEILEVTIVSHNETINTNGLSDTDQAQVEEYNTIESVLAALEQIPERIVGAQSTGVDGVAGATYTSDGIESAVRRCITLAKN